MNHARDEAGDRAPPEPPVGTAVLTFERGRLILLLYRRGGGFLWLDGARPFGGEFATVGAAIQFLKDLSGLYNWALDIGLAGGPAGGA